MEECIKYTKEIELDDGDWTEGSRQKSKVAVKHVVAKVNWIRKIRRKSACLEDRRMCRNSCTSRRRRQREREGGFEDEGRRTRKDCDRYIKTIFLSYIIWLYTLATVESPMGLYWQR